MSPLPRPRLEPVSARALVLGAVLALATAAPLGAQEAEAEADSVATLVGQVVSAMTGGPLPSAKVVLKNAGRGAVTDTTGEFAIPDVPAGNDTVRVSLIGFASEQVPLRLKPGHTTRVTLMLSETVLKVEDITVEVTGGRSSTKLENAGFYRRQKRGLGHYITPEEIEQRHPQEPADLLRNVPGVQVGARTLGRTKVRITRNPVGMDCGPVYWVDGAMFQDYHIDELNRSDIMAIEVYRGPSETPARFKFRGQGCGTIVIWTKEGGYGRR